MLASPSVSIPWAFKKEKLLPWLAFPFCQVVCIAMHSWTSQLCISFINSMPTCLKQCTDLFYWIQNLRHNGSLPKFILGNYKFLACLVNAEIPLCCALSMGKYFFNCSASALNYVFWLSLVIALLKLSETVSSGLAGMLACFCLGSFWSQHPGNDFV